MASNHEYIAELVSNQSWDECYSEIIKGLKQNYRDYELYFALGEYYLSKNINQAYLCYENALFYCDNETDREYIEGVLLDLKEKGVNVKPYSIVIVSYNCIDIMQSCIKSIRDNNDVNANELIVVDNNSSDGICEWLEKQNDIILIKNKDNKGFGAASNQGIKAAAPDNDIFLLNNDTIVVPNSIFWLRMGLYENDRVGAVSCESNFAAGQMIDKEYDSLEEYLEYGVQNNIPDINQYEKKAWLSGFAIMFKRMALDNVGLLDLRYGMGYYEDNDICIRLQYAGYQCIMCLNSFIFHWGAQSFKKDIDKQNTLLDINREKFIDKWGFDLNYYSNSRNDMLNFIEADRSENIKVLEVGCGCGATLSKIKYLWPNAEVAGIELLDNVARIGANNYDIIQGNIETMQLNYQKEYFDYVIFGDVIEHLFNPEETLKKIRAYMKNDGHLIVSIPNIMNITVLLPLLRGEFRYMGYGILDKTHVKFFTIKSAVEKKNKSGFKSESYVCILNEMLGINIPDSQKKEFYKALSCITGVADEKQFETYQYIIRADIEK